MCELFSSELLVVGREGGGVVVVDSFRVSCCGCRGFDERAYQASAPIHRSRGSGTRNRREHRRFMIVDLRGSCARANART